MILSYLLFFFLNHIQNIEYYIYIYILKKLAFMIMIIFYLKNNTYY